MPNDGFYKPKHTEYNVAINTCQITIAVFNSIFHLAAKIGQATLRSRVAQVTRNSLAEIFVTWMEGWFLSEPPDLRN